MLKKTIAYEDFNGQKVEQTCYFHLSKSELVEMEMSRQGGLQAWLTRVIESGDGRSLMEEFKGLILMSYGKRSEDGSRFIKTKELREEFQSSQAYDALFMELVMDGDAAAAFINGIVPGNLQAEMAKLAPASDKPETTGTLRNVFEKNEPKTLTQQEIREMDSEELKEGLAEGRFRLP